MRRHDWLKAGMLATVLLAATAAMAAEGGDDHEGWYLEVGLVSSTPGNVNTPVLASVPTLGALGGSTNLETNVEYMDFDSGTDIQIGFGYSWGRKGKLQVTYWAYSEEETSSGLSTYYPNFNFFTIGPAGSISYDFYAYYSTAFYDLSHDIEQEIKASTIDVEYKRPMELNSETLSVVWGIGLRYASFEDNVDGVYVVDPTGSPYRFPVSREIDSDGIGLTGSIGLEYRFPGKIVGISSNLRVGFILSDIDATHSIIDLDGYYSTAGLRISDSSSMEDEVATTIDFDANLVLRASDRLDFEIGYFFSTWTDLPEVALTRSDLIGSFVGPSSPTIHGEERDRISWSGPRVRARFKF